MLVRQIAVQRENGTTERDARRYDVIVQCIPSLIDEISPNHHRYHLCALSERLHRERHVSQRFVLARRRQHVARAHPRILPNRRRRLHHPFRVRQDRRRERRAQHAVTQH